MRKLSIAIFSFIGALVFIWVSFPFLPARANGTAQLIGWAWSENIGWISFSSKNCDANSNGQSDGTPPGCPPVGTAIAQYAVSRASNGDLSGYAWSENIGWIKFDPAGPYPGNPNKSSRLPNVGTASGWFRAIANDANWDGWMKFDSGGNYGSGVSLGGSQSTTVDGYAWGSDVIGWIHMSGVAQNGSHYAVSIEGGSVSNLNANTLGGGAACSTTPTPSISWTYTDPEGLGQSAYQLQISTTPGFGNPIFDTGKVISTSNTHVVPAGILSYNTTYYYRVRVWNTNDVPTNYTQNTMTTPPHQGPAVNFTWTPTKPPKNTEATFVDSTTFFGNATTSSRTWTFPASATNTTPPATDATEKVKFVAQSNVVTLAVTDTDSIPCSKSQTVTTVAPLLEFKEVAPQ